MNYIKGKFNLQPFFVLQFVKVKGKSHLNRHCISALDTPGRGLILALIQSHNNRGEIPLQVQQTSCLCCAPTQSNRNLVFHNIAALPPPFLFQKGRIHQKSNISVLPPVSVLYIHFISQYHYKIQRRPIPFAIDFIPFIYFFSAGFLKPPTQKKPSLDNSLQNYTSR